MELDLEALVHKNSDFFVVNKCGFWYNLRGETNWWIAHYEIITVTRGQMEYALFMASEFEILSIMMRANDLENFK